MRNFALGALGMIAAVVVGAAAAWRVVSKPYWPEPPKPLQSPNSRGRRQA